MLMNYLKREEVIALDMERIEGVGEQDFDVTNIEALKPVAMLYQVGYLTIDHFDSDTQSYALRVPDEEVRKDLATVVTAAMAKQDASWVSALGRKLLRSVPSNLAHRAFL